MNLIEYKLIVELITILALHKAGYFSYVYIWDSNSIYILIYSIKFKNNKINEKVMKLID